MPTTVQTIGILGAGKVGIVLAQLARKAGYHVLVAGSGDPARIRMTVEVLAPGAEVLSSYVVAVRADITILALPLSKYQSIPATALAGKVVIDAMNHWWEVDGPRQSVLPDAVSSSVAVQDFLTQSRVVKAFNHIGYHHLHDDARPQGTVDRTAIAIAGDDQPSNQLVANLIDQMGFEPLCIGKLADGARLEPGQPAFGAHVTKKELADLTQPVDN